MNAGSWIQVGENSLAYFGNVSTKSFIRSRLWK